MNLKNEMKIFHSSDVDYDWSLCVFSCFERFFFLFLLIITNFWLYNDLDYDDNDDEIIYSTS